MKLPGKTGNGPTNKRLNFGGDSDHRAGYGSGIPYHYCDTARRSLAEVCTMPVLLVVTCNWCLDAPELSKRVHES